MKKCILLLSVIATSVLFAGCNDAKQGGAELSRVWDRSEIVETLGLSQSKSGAQWHFTTENGIKCNVAVVMTTSNAVELYASAGDTVAANTGRTAGLKIVSAETSACLDAGNKLMSMLE